MLPFVLWLLSIRINALQINPHQNGLDSLQSRGGTDHLENLQLLCPSCNRIKGDRPMEYLAAQLAGMMR